MAYRFTTEQVRWQFVPERHKLLIGIREIVFAISLRLVAAKQSIATLRNEELYEEKIHAHRAHAASGRL